MRWPLIAMLPCHLCLISSWELVLSSQEYPTNFLTSFHQRTAPAHRTPLSGNSIPGCHPRSYNTWARTIKATNVFAYRHWWMKAAYNFSMWRRGPQHSTVFEVINFNHKFGSIKDDSCSSIMISLFYSRWNPNSSKFSFHFYFNSLPQMKSKFISRICFCKPGVVGRLTCPVQSYASTKAVGSTFYKFLLSHVFINIFTIIVAIFLLNKETIFS